MKRILSCLLIALLVGMPVVYASEEQAVTENETPENAVLVENEDIHIQVKAKVIEAGETYEETIENILEKKQKVKLEILEGEYQGEEFEATYILSYDIDNKILAYELDEGNTVFAQLTKKGEEITEVIVQDVVRQDYIIWMVALFFISTLLIGRKQGVKAIIGLVITVFAVYFIMISYIYQGYSPIAMSIMTSIGIIIITFIIIAGFNKKAFTAAIGTAGGVLLSGGIAFVFGMLAKLSGGQEEAIMLSISATNITFNFRELLFTGIVIASLGACMDVGMSIASSLDELKQKNPNMTGKELFKSGMNIGGDVIGTMTNTLILAYVGGALNLILLFMASNMQLTDIINKETIASDLISAIAGSMGVIYTIPITAAVYALLNHGKKAYKKEPDNLVEGKRSLKI